MSDYSGWLRLVHLIAVIAWIGPALGAWSYVLRRHIQRKRSAEEWSDFDDWIFREFVKVLQLEHFAFVALIASGILQSHALGYTSGGLFGDAMPWWMQVKLCVVAAAVIPFEVFDTWIAHWVIPEALANRTQDPEAFKLALRRHDLVLRLGGLILGIALPAIFTLVAFRPV
jgi:uncharacterized membrane protein